MSYGRFAAMIGTATVIMFGLMYSTVYALDHVTWSETRSYMAVFMGAVMAIVMLGFMWKVYPNRKTNVGIVIGAGVVIAGGLFLARSQGDGPGRVIHEGHDPSPLDRHPHQRKGRDLRPKGEGVGR